MGCTTLGHRRMRGQVFTPQLVARFMVRWACVGEPRSFLDPALGLGIFLRELVALKLRHVPRVSAYEIEAELAACVMHALAASLPQLHVELNDFVLAPISERFDAIVANPPYIRHHSLPYGPDVFEGIGAPHRVRLSRLTNIYALFLLRSLRLLSERGRMAFITPAEFLNADFGVPVKAAMLGSKHLDAIIYFDHADLLFEGTLTTAAITLFDAGRSPERPVRLIHVSDGADLDEVLAQLTIHDTGGSNGHCWSMHACRTDELDPSTKWRPHFVAGVTHRKSKHPRLGEFVRTRRGIATGANSFFTLTETERLAHGLSDAEVVPCMTKAGYVKSLEFLDRDFESIRKEDKKSWLINLSEPLSHAGRAYVKLGEERGISARFLPRCRSPWYSNETAPPAPIWVGVFSRGGFRFVLNKAGIRSLTTFHGIYPAFAEETLLKALVAMLVSPSGAAELHDAKRVYGGGLDKLEPRDLLTVRLPDPRQLRDGQVDALARAFDRFEAILRAQAGETPANAMDELHSVVMTVAA
ncbi:MAG TPA: N-6 DNA methylase [Hyphomonadaceae bacterium]|nr:N-6 DNA methylase [Hyphomonadaceae bacterium]